MFKNIEMLKNIGETQVPRNQQKKFEKQQTFSK